MNWLPILLIISWQAVSAQSTFTSLEQRKFIHTATGMDFRGIMRLSVDIEFHIPERYIVIRDKNDGSESNYINVIQAEHKDSWQAYSVKSKKNYLFMLQFTDQSNYIIIDDGSMAFYYKVLSAHSNSSKSKN